MFLPYNAPVSPSTAPIILPGSAPMFPSQPNMFASLPPSHLTSFRLPAFVDSGSPHQIPRYPSQISPISPFGSTSQHPFMAERNYSNLSIAVDAEASLPTYIRNGVRVFDGPAVPSLPGLCGEYEMMMARRQFELSYKFPGSPEGRPINLFPKQPNSEQKSHETGKCLERNYISGGNSLNMNPSDNTNWPISTFRPDEIVAKRCSESGKRKRVEVEQPLSIETNVGSAVKLCRNGGNSDSRQPITNNNRMSKLANVTNEQKTEKIERKTNTVPAIVLDRADKNETIRKHNIWRPAIDSCYEKQSTEIQFHPNNTAVPQIWNPHYPIIPNKIPNIETNVSKLGGSVVKQPSPIPAATASPGSNPATDFYSDTSSHWWSVSETTSQLLPSQIAGQPRRSDTVHGLLSVANGYIVARTRRCRRCRCPNCVNPSPPSPDSTMEPGSSPTTKKLHICHVAGCGKVYGKTSHLKAHLRWHAGERPFVCTWMFCRKCFTRSDELQRHIKTHTGDKKFCCRECGKRFTRSDHLSKHNKTHEQRRDGGRVEPANQTYSSHKPRPNKQLKHTFSSQTPDRKIQPTTSINGRGYNEPISTQDNHVTSASHWNEDTQRKRTTQVDQNNHVQSDVVSCLESESSKREVWVQNSADEESLDSELSDDEEIDVDV